MSTIPAAATTVTTPALSEPGPTPANLQPSNGLQFTSSQSSRRNEYGTPVTATGDYHHATVVPRDTAERFLSGILNSSTSTNGTSTSLTPTVPLTTTTVASTKKVTSKPLTIDLTEDDDETAPTATSKPSTTSLLPKSIAPPPPSSASVAMLRPTPSTSLQHATSSSATSSTSVPPLQSSTMKLPNPPPAIAPHPLHVTPTPLPPVPLQPPSTSSLTNPFLNNLPNPWDYSYPSRSNGYSPSPPAMAATSPWDLFGGHPSHMNPLQPPLMYPSPSPLAPLPPPSYTSPSYNFQSGNGMYGSSHLPPPAYMQPQLPSMSLTGSPYPISPSPSPPLNMPLSNGHFNQYYGASGLSRPSNQHSMNHHLSPSIGTYNQQSSSVQMNYRTPSPVPLAPLNSRIATGSTARPIIPISDDSSDSDTDGLAPGQKRSIPGVVASIQQFMKSQSKKSTQRSHRPDSMNGHNSHAPAASILENHSLSKTPAVPSVSSKPSSKHTSSPSPLPNSAASNGHKKTSNKSPLPPTHSSEPSIRSPSPMLGTIVPSRSDAMDATDPSTSVPLDAAAEKRLKMRLRMRARRAKIRAAEEEKKLKKALKEGNHQPRPTGNMIPAAAAAAASSSSYSSKPPLAPHSLRSQRPVAIKLPNGEELYHDEPPPSAKEMMSDMDDAAQENEPSSDDADERESEAKDGESHQRVMRIFVPRRSSESLDGVDTPLSDIEPPPLHWLRRGLSETDSPREIVQSIPTRIGVHEVNRYQNQFRPPILPPDSGDLLGVGVQFSATSPHQPKHHLAKAIEMDVTESLQQFQHDLKLQLQRELTNARHKINRRAQQVYDTQLAIDELLPFSKMTRSKESDRKMKQHPQKPSSSSFPSSTMATAAISVPPPSPFHPPWTLEQNLMVMREIRRTPHYEISLGIQNAPTLLEASKSPDYPYFTSEAARDHPVPERTIFSTIKRNITTQDDKRLRFVPYFGDEALDTVDASMYTIDVKEDEDEEMVLQRDACILNICHKYGDSEKVFQSLAKSLNQSLVVSPRPKKKPKKPVQKKKRMKRSKRNNKSDDDEMRDPDQDHNSKEPPSSSSSSSSSDISDVDEEESEEDEPPFTAMNLKQRWQQLSSQEDRRQKEQFERLQLFGCDSVEQIQKVELFKQEELTRQSSARSAATKSEESKSNSNAVVASSLPVDLFSYPPTAAASTNLNLLNTFETHLCRRCYMYDCRLHGQSQPRVQERQLPTEIELKEIERLEMTGAQVSPWNEIPQMSPILRQQSSNGSQISRPMTPIEKTPKSSPHAMPLSGSTVRSSPTLEPLDSSTMSQLPCGTHCYRLMNTPLADSIMSPCVEPGCRTDSGVAPPTEWSEFEKMMLRKLIYIFSSSNAPKSTYGSLDVHATNPSITTFPYCALANTLGTKTCREVASFVEQHALSAPFLTLASRRAQEAARIQPPDLEATNAAAAARAPRGKKRKRKAAVGTRAALQLRLKADFRRSQKNLPHAYVACKHPGLECSDPNADCPCHNHQLFCEKFCDCSLTCSNRFLGCNCSKSSTRCHTRACECFAANRECDPDLCKMCDFTTTHNHTPEDGAQEEEMKQQQSSPHSVAAAAASSSSTVPSLRPCLNSALQSGDRHPLLLGESDVHGWGCFLSTHPNTAPRPIRRNELITEYFGELISQEEADRRGKIYDRLNRSYLFNLNFEYVVDAARKGNKIKFANHSQQPNCYSKVMLVNGAHRIGIYAFKNIKPGEELLFDYQHEHSGSTPAWMKQDEANHHAGGGVKTYTARKSTSGART